MSRVVVAVVLGGLFGCFSVVLRAADDWSGITIEIVGGAWFLALVGCAALGERLGVSPLHVVPSTIVGFLVTGAIWASSARDSHQIGLNWRWEPGWPRRCRSASGSASVGCEW